MNLVGPLPQRKGRVKYMIIVVDYFIKWAKEEPMATITNKAVTRFLCKNIVCRFRILKIIIINNGH